MDKIVFFDIDGTLLDDEKNLPPKTEEAIKTLQGSGIFVAFATGRAPFSFRDLRKELGVDSYVCFNGQYVVFENELIYSNPLDREELKKISVDSRERKHPLVFMDEKTMKGNVSNHRFIKVSMDSLKFLHPEKDENYFLKKDIYQTLLFCEDREEEDYFTYEKFRFVRWHPYCVDVLPSGGSKAEGIRKLIERIGIKMENVYAFGDALNDIEMIQTVGTGVAMGNALEEVKKNADFVTKGVSEDGIWYGLKKLQLI